MLVALSAAVVVAVKSCSEPGEMGFWRGGAPGGNPLSGLCSVQDLAGLRTQASPPPLPRGVFSALTPRGPMAASENLGSM